MPIKTARGPKGTADRYYSLIIRSIGYCEKCGTSEGLTTSHIIKRRYSATRTDLWNSQCLCFSCHRYFEDWPKEFSRWITDTIGTEKYEELRLKAQPTTKMDWKQRSIELRELWKRIEKEETTLTEARDENNN